MTLQLPIERHQKILNELRKAKERIYKKKVTPVRTTFPYQNSVPQNISNACPIVFTLLVEQNNKGEYSSFSSDNSILLAKYYAFP
jgi:hypothetical protein